WAGGTESNAARSSSRCGRIRSLPALDGPRHVGGVEVLEDVVALAELLSLPGDLHRLLLLSELVEDLRLGPVVAPGGPDGGGGIHQLERPVQIEVVVEEILGGGRVRLPRLIDGPLDLRKDVALGVDAKRNAQADLLPFEIEVHRVVAGVGKDVGEPLAGLRE